MLGYTGGTLMPFSENKTRFGEHFVLAHIMSVFRNSIIDNPSMAWFYIIRDESAVKHYQSVMGQGQTHQGPI